MAAHAGDRRRPSPAAPRHVGEDVADIMAGFSSRGPNRAVSMISPCLSAPGVDILAGNGTDNEDSWGFISGTSMASPHIAGSYALIKAVHPEWTPAEAQSALMTTTKTDVRDTDCSDADWFDMGSGRVDLTKVAKAGLVLDVTEDGVPRRRPRRGWRRPELNTASMADNECLAELLVDPFLHGDRDRCRHLDGRRREPVRRHHPQRRAGHLHRRRRRDADDHRHGRRRGRSDRRLARSAPWC